MLGRGTMHGPNIAEFSHYEAGMDPFANFLFAFDAADKLTGAVINLSTTGQCGNPDQRDAFRRQKVRPCPCGTL